MLAQKFLKKRKSGKKCDAHWRVRKRIESTNVSGVVPISVPFFLFYFLPLFHSIYSPFHLLAHHPISSNTHQFSALPFPSISTIKTTSHLLALAAVKCSLCSSTKPVPDLPKHIAEVAKMVGEGGEIYAMQWHFRLLYGQNYRMLFRIDEIIYATHYCAFQQQSMSFLSLIRNTTSQPRLPSDWHIKLLQNNNSKISSNRKSHQIKQR